MSHLNYRALLLSTFMSTVSPLCGAAAVGGSEISAQRPIEHLCPITQEVMQDPVVASDGFSYEREAILRWVNAKHTSPMTRGAMSNDVYPNQILRTMINEWKAEAPRIRSVLSDMSPDEIIEMLREEFAKNEALLTQEHTAKDKDIVVFLGNTGAGKSTLINFLAGKELQINEQRYELRNSSDPGAMPIGTQMFNSETLYPKSIDIAVDQDATLRFFDLPGLNDTDGSVRNLVNAAFVRHILLEAKTVRFVYVAGQDQFTADRGRSVQQTLNALHQLFVTATDPSRPLDSGLLVVSKETGLLKGMASWTETNTPEQIRRWKDQDHITQMYHSSLDAQNTPQHRQAILERIAGLVPQRLISVNASGLYPSETRGDIEGMYSKMYDAAYQRAKEDRKQTLSELHAKLELWQRETFWDEFEARYVYDLYPSVNVLKDLTIQTYSKLRKKYVSEQEAGRQAHIGVLKELIKEKEARLRTETEERAHQIVEGIRGDQAQYGRVPYDFANQQLYWDRVCGADVLEGITKDATEQEIIRKAYVQWIGEHYQKQVENNAAMARLELRVASISEDLKSKAAAASVTERMESIAGALKALKSNISHKKIGGDYLTSSEVDRRIDAL